MDCASYTYDGAMTLGPFKLVVLVAACLLLGCSRKTADGAGVRPDASAAPVVIATPDARSPLLPPFAVSKEPSARDVTAGPVSGSLNGRKFEPKTILFQPYEMLYVGPIDRWELVMSDTAFGAEESPPQNAHLVRVHLAQLPVKGLAGKNFGIASPMTVSCAVPTGDDHPWTLGTLGSFWIEITKWDVKPYDPKMGTPGSQFQAAGTASGRIYAACEGFDQPDASPLRILASGASGTFTDVPVRYHGKPGFDK
jgi:hypothetical protein